MVVEPTFWDGSQVAGSVTCTSDDQRMVDKGRMQCVVEPAASAPMVLDRAAFNSGENAQYKPFMGEAQVMPPLVAKGPHAVAYGITDDETCAADVCPTISTPSASGGGHPPAVAHAPAIATSLTVRRLTPTECERLQGFPDGYTSIPYGRPREADQQCPDGPRYKALGNSMAVNVMRWIGQQIDRVETGGKQA